MTADGEAREEPDPEERRTTFGAFLAGAAQVFAPSSDTARRLNAVYPDLAITVRPHFEADRRIRPAIRKRGEGRRRVAVLGAINMMKGARFLQALATDARIGPYRSTSPSWASPTRLCVRRSRPSASLRPAAT